MKELIKKLFNIESIRFVFVGGINTLVGYGSYALFLMFNINYLISNTLSTIIGVANSYIWNRNFTFKSKASVKEELTKFVSVYLVSYLISMLSIYILVSKLGVNEYVGGLLNLVVTTLISYFGHKKFSFRR